MRELKLSVIPPSAEIITPMVIRNEGVDYTVTWDSDTVIISPKVYNEFLKESLGELEED